MRSLLIINCPRDVAAEIEDVITAAKPTLAIQFQENLKPYRAFRDTVGKIVRPIHESGAYAELKNVATELAAKIATGLIKPGP